MNGRWFVRILLMTCWVPLVLAVVAVCYETLQITGRATQYVALGKIVAGVKVNPRNESPLIDSPQNNDFYGTQIEILEGGDLKRRALERVRGLHPELKEVEVDIRVTQTRGSGILKVAAIGEEQKYTRVYLDALLDEYMAFRQEMVEKSVGTAMNKVIEEVLAREKRVKQEVQALDAFQKDHDELLLTTEHERLAKSVSTERGELESLERAGGADDKLKAGREALADTEKKFAEASQALSTLSGLKEKYKADLEDYEVWRKNLDRLEASLKSQMEYVAIMERPSVAIEDKPDLVGPLRNAAFIGAGVGLVLILLASTIVGMANRGGA
jgi:hypothetical protein